MIHLPPGQQLAAADKWPVVGERAPSASDAPWMVEVTGLVERRMWFSLAELAEFPQVERAIDIHCVTRWSKPGARFKGVPLVALLDRARPLPAARFVSFVARSPRAHTTSLPLADALRLESLVALRYEGRPLVVEHGGPVRTVVPGRYFYKSLKWLTRIELLEKDRLGYWEAEAGYHNTADPWREQRFLASNVSKREAAALLATRDFRARDLRGIDAAGHDLAGLRAEGALLRDADFRRATLRGACFDGANLSNARFAGADLRGATFLATDMEGADLTAADLRGADFSGAAMTAVTFCGETPDARGLSPAAILDETTRIDATALELLMPVQQEFLRGRLP